MEIAIFSILVLSQSVSLFHAVKDIYKWPYDICVCPSYAINHKSMIMMMVVVHCTVVYCVQCARLEVWDSDICFVRTICSSFLDWITNIFYSIYGQVALMFAVRCCCFNFIAHFLLFSVIVNRHACRILSAFKWEYNVYIWLVNGPIYIQFSGIIKHIPWLCVTYTFGLIEFFFIIINIRLAIQLKCLH